MNEVTQKTTTLGERQLKMLIKETIKESIDSEVMRLRAALLPYVSAKEQKEIERLYGKPSRKIARSYNLEV